MKEIDIIAEVNVRLAAVRTATQVADTIQAEAKEALTALHEQYAGRIGAANDALAAIEKDLRAFAKKNKAAIFDGKDRVDFANGFLLFQIVRRVRRAKSITVDLLESLGLDAVKTVKSVDWDAIERWPTEKLVLIGTERKPTEKIEYEVHGGPK